LEPERRLELHDIDETERPRERLLDLGAGVLTDAELIAVLLGTGSAGTPALGGGV
jgi:DNA repair protein RadC